VFDAEQRAALKVIRIPKSQGEVARAQSEGMDDASLSAYFHGFVKSLSDEIALLSRLKGNSNIVSYEDHQIIENPVGEGVGWTILICMELLTPLLEHMRAQPLHQREVLRLGLDPCRALTLCQREHIIHRDIKPDNILCRPAAISSWATSAWRASWSKPPPGFRARAPLPTWPPRCSMARPTTPPLTFTRWAWCFTPC
jgi:serine/threonine protein kinase